MPNTPGVYVQEVSTLPPSVAEVATAIPAFIGYTEKGAGGKVEIAQVNTLLEYEQRFGKPRPTAFSASADGSITPALASSVPATPLWYALNLYFLNGGGRCYVVSIGNYEAMSAASGDRRSRYEDGLTALKAEDEPTLIVMPDAVSLLHADFKQVCQAALLHCGNMGDRFAILDVKPDPDPTESPPTPAGGEPKPPVAVPKPSGPPADTGPATEPFDPIAEFRKIGTDNLHYGAAYHPYVKTTLLHTYDETAVTVDVAPAAPPSASTQPRATTTSPPASRTLASLAHDDTTLYNTIKKRLGDQRVVLPPSAAIAGIYARVDRDRGVWKAPANVSLSAVIGPTEAINNDRQEALNVDAQSGKSINAIRAFTGKGTLVWGARTLAGNDNEWRYVNVRRLFIMIEESAKKATAFAVFEANDATTWLKVKGMAESYLYGLWEQGALQGAKPEQAYYVNVGLGKTMTAQDILEGRMIVEIGIAAVRPAEFITLRFFHKLPEA